MHSQNEQKMSLGGFSSTHPTISPQSGHRGAGDRLENSSVSLHWIHFTVVKQVMVVPQNVFKFFSRWILNKVIFDPCHLFLGTEQHQCLVSLQEPRSKCVHRVSLAARWKWRRSWASRATQRSKLLSPGLAPTYSPPSDRDTTTSTVSRHTRHRQTHCARLPSDSGGTCMRYMICDGLSHLPLHCPKRRHSVCVCRPVHLSLTVSARALVIFLHTAWSSATCFRPPLERHACLWTDHTHLQI